MLTRPGNGVSNNNEREPLAAQPDSYQILYVGQGIRILGTSQPFKVMDAEDLRQMTSAQTVPADAEPCDHQSTNQETTSGVHTSTALTSSDDEWEMAMNEELSEPDSSASDLSDIEILSRSPSKDTVKTSAADGDKVVDACALENVEAPRLDDDGNTGSCSDPQSVTAAPEALLAPQYPGVLGSCQQEPEIVGVKRKLPKRTKIHSEDWKGDNDAVTAILKERSKGKKMKNTSVGSRKMVKQISRSKAGPISVAKQEIKKSQIVNSESSTENEEDSSVLRKCSIIRKKRKNNKEKGNCHPAVHHTPVTSESDPETIEQESVKRVKRRKREKVEGLVRPVSDEVTLRQHEVPDCKKAELVIELKTAAGSDELTGYTQSEMKRCSRATDEGIKMSRSRLQISDENHIQDTPYNLQIVLSAEKSKVKSRRTKKAGDNIKDEDTIRYMECGLHPEKMKGVTPSEDIGELRKCAVIPLSNGTVEHPEQAREHCQSARNIEDNNISLFKYKDALSREEINLRKINNIDENNRNNVAKRKRKIGKSSQKPQAHFKPLGDFREKNDKEVSIHSLFDEDVKLTRMPRKNSKLTTVVDAIDDAIVNRLKGVDNPKTAKANSTTPSKADEELIATASLNEPLIPECLGISTHKLVSQMRIPHLGETDCRMLKASKEVTEHTVDHGAWKEDGPEMSSGCNITSKAAMDSKTPDDCLITARKRSLRKVKSRSKKEAPGKLQSAKYGLGLAAILSDNQQMKIQQTVGQVIPDFALMGAQNQERSLHKVEMAEAGLNEGRNHFTFSSFGTGHREKSIFEVSEEPLCFVDRTDVATDGSCFVDRTDVATDGSSVDPAPPSGRPARKDKSPTSGVIHSTFKAKYKCKGRTSSCQQYLKRGDISKWRQLRRLLVVNKRRFRAAHDIGTFDDVGTLFELENAEHGADRGVPKVTTRPEMCPQVPELAQWPTRNRTCDFSVIDAGNRPTYASVVKGTRQDVCLSNQQQQKNIEMMPCKESYAVTQDSKECLKTGIGGLTGSEERSKFPCYGPVKNPEISSVKETYEFPGFKFKSYPSLSPVSNEFSWDFHQPGESCNVSAGFNFTTQTDSDVTLNWPFPAAFTRTSSLKENHETGHVVSAIDEKIACDHRIFTRPAADGVVKSARSESLPKPECVPVEIGASSKFELSPSQAGQTELMEPGAAEEVPQIGQSPQSSDVTITDDQPLNWPLPLSKNPSCKFGFGDAPRHAADEHEFPQTQNLSDTCSLFHSLDIPLFASSIQSQRLVPRIRASPNSSEMSEAVGISSEDENFELCRSAIRSCQQAARCCEGATDLVHRVEALEKQLVDLNSLLLKERRDQLQNGVYSDGVTARVSVKSVKFKSVTNKRPPKSITHKRLPKSVTHKRLPKSASKVNATMSGVYDTRITSLENQLTGIREALMNTTRNPVKIQVKCKKLHMQICDRNHINNTDQTTGGLITLTQQDNDARESSSSVQDVSVQEYHLEMKDRVRNECPSRTADFFLDHKSTAEAKDGNLVQQCVSCVRDGDLMEERTPQVGTSDMLYHNLVAERLARAEGHGLAQRNASRLGGVLISENVSNVGCQLQSRAEDSRMNHTTLSSVRNSDLSLPQFQKTLSRAENHDLIQDTPSIVEGIDPSSANSSRVTNSDKIKQSPLRVGISDQLKKTLSTLVNPDLIKEILSGVDFGQLVDVHLNSKVDTVTAQKTTRKVTALTDIGAAKLGEQDHHTLSRQNENADTNHASFVGIPDAPDLVPQHQGSPRQPYTQLNHLCSGCRSILNSDHTCAPTTRLFSTDESESNRFPLPLDDTRSRQNLKMPAYVPDHSSHSPLPRSTCMEEHAKSKTTGMVYPFREGSPPATPCLHNRANPSFQNSRMSLLPKPQPSISQNRQLNKVEQDHHAVSRQNANADVNHVSFVGIPNAPDLVPANQGCHRHPYTQLNHLCLGCISILNSDHTCAPTTRLFSTDESESNPLPLPSDATPNRRENLKMPARIPNDNNDIAETSSFDNHRLLISPPDHSSHSPLPRSTCMEEHAKPKTTIIVYPFREGSPPATPCLHDRANPSFQNSRISLLPKPQPSISQNRQLNKVEQDQHALSRQNANADVNHVSFVRIPNAPDLVSANQGSHRQPYTQLNHLCLGCRSILNSDHACAPTTRLFSTDESESNPFPLPLDDTRSRQNLKMPAYVPDHSSHSPSPRSTCMEEHAKRKTTGMVYPFREGSPPATPCLHDRANPSCQNSRTSSSPKPQPCISQNRQLNKVAHYPEPRNGYNPCPSKYPVDSHNHNIFGDRRREMSSPQTVATEPILPIDCSWHSVNNVGNSIQDSHKRDMMCKTSACSGTSYLSEGEPNLWPTSGKIKHSWNIGNSYPDFSLMLRNSLEGSEKKSPRQLPSLSSTVEFTDPGGRGVDLQNAVEDTPHNGDFTTTCPGQEKTKLSGCFGHSVSQTSYIPCINSGYQQSSDASTHSCRQGNHDNKPCRHQSSPGTQTEFQTTSKQEVCLQNQHYQIPLYDKQHQVPAFKGDASSRPFHACKGAHFLENNQCFMTQMPDAYEALDLSTRNKNSSQQCPSCSNMHHHFLSNDALAAVSDHAHVTNTRLSSLPSMDYSEDGFPNDHHLRQAYPAVEQLNSPAETRCMTSHRNYYCPCCCPVDTCTCKRQIEGSLSCPEQQPS